MIKFIIKIKEGKEVNGLQTAYLHINKRSFCETETEQKVTKIIEKRLKVNEKNQFEYIREKIEKEKLKELCNTLEEIFNSI